MSKRQSKTVRSGTFCLIFGMAFVTGILIGAGTGVQAAQMIETPYFADAVKAGDLPTVGDRIPQDPAIFTGDDGKSSLGVQGGNMRMLMGRVKDVRMAVVYGYARLIGFDRDFNL